MEDTRNYQPMAAREEQPPGADGWRWRGWRRVALGFFLVLVFLGALLALVPQPRTDGPSLPGPATGDAAHWQPKRASSLLNIHFGWGLRDRIWALAQPVIDWTGDRMARLQAKLQGGDPATELGAREIVYELAEKDGRDINILNIAPFVHKSVGGGTTEAAGHPYWVAKAIVDIRQDEPAGIRSDSFPPLALGFIIDGKTGTRYVVGADILDKFLVRGDLSLIQNMDVFDTHSLRYQIKNSQHR